MILMTRVFAASLGLALAACGADTRLRLNEDPAKRGKDEMAITSHDGKMVLAVRLDSIRMRLSDSARKAVTADIATNTTDTNGGVGAWIEGFRCSSSGSLRAWGGATDSQRPSTVQTGHRRRSQQCRLRVS